MKTRWEGVEREWTAALVNAEGLTGVELSGEGTIDGSGEQWTQNFAQPPPGANTTGAVRRGKPRLICFQSCRRVRVAGLTLRNQAAWGLHILYSEDVVVVRDCVAEAGNWAPVRFKTQPSRGGVVENITYRNFRLCDVRRAFEMNMAWTSSRGTLEPAAKVLPVFRRIRLINVSGTAQSGGVIRGLKDSPIENVVFEDCRVTAETGLVVEHAREMDYSGLKLTVKEGAPVVLKGGE